MKFAATGIGSLAIDPDGGPFGWAIEGDGQQEVDAQALNMGRASSCAISLRFGNERAACRIAWYENNNEYFSE